MNSLTHMIVGGLTGGITAALAISAREPMLHLGAYDIFPAAVAVGAVIGGLAPDVDMKKSVAGKLTRIVLRISLVLSAILLAASYFFRLSDIRFFGRTLIPVSGIDRIYPLILAVFCLVLLVIIEKSKHRGFTHTIVSLAMISAPALYIMLRGIVFQSVNLVLSVQLGFSMGWLSHMAADTFNYPGVPWLWPLTNNHFNIARVDSGTKEETAFCTVTVIAFVAVYVFIAIM